MVDNIIFHIDVNSAFLSWEAAYRSELDIGDVDLRTIPSVVGGDIKKRRGIVLAKSIPAKQYNIKTGESLVSAVGKCPHLIVIKPTYRLYKKASDAFFSVLREYSPYVEQYSVDEGFMDYTASQSIFGDPIQTANQIRERMKEELGFTVNIGISHNKLLAKMASEFEKPDKTHTLFANEIETKMWPLDVSELFMVGRRTGAALKKLGILTIGDLAHTEIDFLVRRFKHAQGHQLYRYANGIDASVVKAFASPHKSVGNSTTIASDVTKREDALSVILSLCETVAQRLRKYHLNASVIEIGIKSSTFHYSSTQCSIYEPTNHTDIIYRTCICLFDRLWKHDPIRHIAVSTMKLSQTSITQLSLFDQTQKKARVDWALDDLRDKLGKTSLIRGTLLNSSTSAMSGGTQNNENFPMMNSHL